MPIKKLPALKSKGRLREKVSQLQFSPQAYLARSMQVSAKIQKSKFFKDAQTIGFYAALSDEIDIFPAAQKALSFGKRVFFPKMRGAKIDFYEVKDFEIDLIPGKFGVLEPLSKAARFRKSELDLILIPGRAFDKKGGRLGRGGGHYDRLLARWPGSVRMGVAFREQILPTIPSEPHDIQMDVILTA